MMTIRRAKGLALLAAVAASAACSSSGSNGNSDAGNGSSSSASRDAAASGSSTGNDASASNGSVVDGSTSSDAGVTSEADANPAATCSDAGTLYSRLGGHTGIRNAIEAIVAAELKDPDIASYFFNQVATPHPAGHPGVGQIEECFTDLLGAVAGGPESYPPDGGAYDDGGQGGPAGVWMCRDMPSIHQPLMISGGTFDKFIVIAAGVLQSAGVSSCDIATVGAALEGTRGPIVYAPLADAGEMPYPGDAGGH